ncbi:MAG: prolyl oligopeptidase family serine peptidase [Lentimicrobium sp.]|nr:prolyl oligopeptidase family serine peptidase [Lentimicrobium sp.]
MMIFVNDLCAQQQPKWDDISKNKWNSEFELVEIISSKDSSRQKAYLYRTKSKKPRPLIISLHTWSGDYTQKDPLADEALAREYNYIHPDFRGPNNNPLATGSNLAISDIEDAIRFAVNNTNTDPKNVHIIGTSGGGMAVLLAYMNVQYPVKSFSAWAPISDLEAWYWESIGRQQKYAIDILKSISMDSVFNAEEALRRSPLFQRFPKDIRKEAELFIYEGIHDGYTGSVPITHAINMYNRLAGELKYNLYSIPAIMEKASSDPDLVSEREIINLVTKRCNPSFDKLQTINDRPIYLYRKYNNISLTIFEGTHEQLSQAFSMIPIIEESSSFEKIE